jgi:hypothetical protein
METHDALDDLTNDGRTVAHRARAEAMLDQIAQQLLNRSGWIACGCRPVTCATTDSLADHQPQATSVQPTEPSGCRPAPMPTPVSQHSGAGR